MMKTYHLPVKLILLLGAVAVFPAIPGHAAALPDPGVIAVGETRPGETDDPSYRVYRDGYHAILQERWGEARKLFAELRKRYPRSRYRDDAEYWTAYSWKQDDPAKARTAYQKFIQERPTSTYFGDAVADLRMLEIEAALAEAQTQTHPLSLTEHEIRIRLPEELRRIEQEMERLARAQSQFHQNMMIIREGDTLLAKAPPSPLRIQIFAPFADDPDIQIRITALDAMVGGKRDGATYSTLHDVALDTRQPVPVRQVALNSLAGFPEKDPAAVFLTLATRDTSETVQRTAIELFAGSNRSRGDRTDRLIELYQRFQQTAPRRMGALSTTLYSLAAIGDDRATDFIARIARSEKDETLRSDAVYYLGNIGTERARQELVKIIRGE
jgi:hypothetical protein